MVKVSVVVPTFNEEKNIRACLKSIKEQTFSDFELIVADGNSTDKTREIAKKFTNKIVIEKVRSPAAERQTGARIAKGSIIAFIDADTVAEKEWLEKIISSFKDPHVVGVYGAVYLKDGNIIDNIFCKFFFNPYLYLTNILHLNAVAGMNMAVKKRVFEKIGGFNLSFVSFEDIDLFARMRKFGKIKFLNTKVYTSTRRIRKWGYLKFFLYHFKNNILYLIKKEAQKEYEPVR